MGRRSMRAERGDAGAVRQGFPWGRVRRSVRKDRVSYSGAGFHSFGSDRPAYRAGKAREYS